MAQRQYTRITREKIREYGRFVIGGLFASAAQLLLTWWLTTHHQTATIEAIMWGQMLNSTINFPIQKYMVFKEKSADTLPMEIFNHIKISVGWLIVTILSSMYVQHHITHHPLLILIIVAPVKSVLAFLIQRRRVFKLRW